MEDAGLVGEAAGAVAADGVAETGPSKRWSVYSKSHMSATSTSANHLSPILVTQTHLGGDRGWRAGWSPTAEAGWATWSKW